MFSDERIRSQNGFRWPMLILGFSMTLIYILLGIYILWGYKFMHWIPAEISQGVAKIPNEFRNIFAIMLIVYGTYRGWRVYSDYF